MEQVADKTKETGDQLSHFDVCQQVEQLSKSENKFKTYSIH